MTTINTDMASKKITQRIKDINLKILEESGEDGLYDKIVDAAIAVTSLGRSGQEIELLDFSESFMNLYRRTGENDYKLISKVFRRAAHKVHRELIKIKKQAAKDARLLTLVA